MDIQFSWWLLLLLSVPLYLIILGIAYISSRKYKNNKYGITDYEQADGVHIKRFCKVLIILVIILNLASLAITDMTSDDAYSHEVASYIGLDSGKPYPIDLGGRTEKISGNAHFFGLSILGTGAISGSGSVTSTSTLSIGFQTGEYSSILELPVNKVRFKQIVGAEPSATILLNDVQLVEEPYEVGGRGQIWLKSRTNLNSGLLISNHEHSKTSLNAGLIDAGLTPIISRAFDRAEITLSPEDYKRILNNP